MIDSYDKLPIGKYRELCSIDPETPDIDRQVEMVSILSDIPADDLYNMPVTEYTRLAAKTAFLGTEPPTPNPRAAKEYRLGDTILVPSVDIRKMTTAQFIDFQTYVREPDKNEVEILSVFLIPKGKRYNDGYDIVEVRRLIAERLTLPIAQDLRAFFLSRCRSYARAILTYSEWMARKAPREERARLLTEIAEARKAMGSTGNGDGSETSTRCPRPADVAGMRSGIWP